MTGWLAVSVCFGRQLEKIKEMFWGDKLLNEMGFDGNLMNMKLMCFKKKKMRF